eukprot:16168920-Heterocapsa_arctica.AAC.1
MFVGPRRGEACHVPFSVQCRDETPLSPCEAARACLERQEQMLQAGMRATGHSDRMLSAARSRSCKQRATWQ